MNGATALDCENTISRPNSTKTMTIGTSQYFFSCLRNWKNSPRTRPLLMIPSLRCSVHLIVVLAVAIALRIGGPARPFVATTCQRIASHQTPDQTHRRQHDQEQERQPKARHHAAECQREFPPVLARIFEQRWCDEA